jgi:hypothetical protein
MVDEDLIGTVVMVVNDRLGVLGQIAIWLSRCAKTITFVEKVLGDVGRR